MLFTLTKISLKRLWANLRVFQYRVELRRGLAINPSKVKQKPVLFSGDTTSRRLRVGSHIHLPCRKVQYLRLNLKESFQVNLISRRANEWQRFPCTAVEEEIVEKRRGAVSFLRIDVDREVCYQKNKYQLRN